MAPLTEPSNAELMTVLQQHMATSQATAREQAAASATLQAEMRELRGSLTAQGAKILEIDRRLTKTEHDAKRLRDSQAELEGSLLREVGALASNDRAQNATLAAIKSDVGTQGKKLDGIVEQTKDAIAADLKAVGRKYGGYCVAAMLGAPKFWEFANWLIHFFGRALT